MATKAQIREIMKISVIICTHNPRKDYLQKTLNSIRMQTLHTCDWELLLIDNASQPEVKLPRSWLDGLQAKLVCEKQIGLTKARLRGISESKGNLLVFVDDDNILQTNYLEKAWGIYNNYSSLGCFGAGNIEPEYEAEPNAEVKPHTCYLALRKNTHDLWSNNPDDDSVPWGAGLCIRRSVAIQYASIMNSVKSEELLGRNGTNLLSCEDNEISFTACQMQLGKGIFHELKIVHLIDKKRVEKQYIWNLVESISYSRALLLNKYKSYIPEYESVPGWRTVGDLLKTKNLNMQNMIKELRRTWQKMKKSKYDQAIDAAWILGKNRALNEIIRRTI